MEGTNLNYVVHSSELASELVVDTKLKPCALLVHKGVNFSLSTTVYTDAMVTESKGFRPRNIHFFLAFIIHNFFFLTRSIIKNCLNVKQACLKISTSLLQYCNISFLKSNTSSFLSLNHANNSFLTFSPMKSCP